MEKKGKKGKIMEKKGKKGKKRENQGEKGHIFITKSQFLGYAYNSVNNDFEAIWSHEKLKKMKKSSK